MKSEILFNGIVYKLMGQKRYYLSTSNTNEGRKRAKGLHVAIWEHYHQKTVPKDFVVHHIDGDYKNNDLSNLECISKEKHFSLHREQKISFGRNSDQLIHLNQIREKAKKWHKSPEGLVWHSNHAKNQRTKVKPRIVNCSECHKDFETKSISPAYACKECKNIRGERLRPIISIPCKICGNLFQTKKHGKRTTQTCSGACKGKLILKNGGGLNCRSNCKKITI